jgi:hypothetical protein
MEKELFKVKMAMTELLDIVDTLMSIMIVKPDAQELLKENEEIMKRIKEKWYPVTF